MLLRELGGHVLLEDLGAVVVNREEITHAERGSEGLDLERLVPVVAVEDKWPRRASDESSNIVCPSEQVEPDEPRRLLIGPSHIDGSEPLDSRGEPPRERAAP